MKLQTGGARVVAALEDANVRCVFGLPGTQLLALFEGLRHSRVRTVVPTNELAAAFMAGGWARASGEPGVVITIPGPGFMWALNGIAEARLDAVPLVHISGTVGEDAAERRFRQQYLAQAAIAAPLVKAVKEVGEYEDPANVVLAAIELARSPTPGPVLVHVSAATLSREFSRSPRATAHAPATPIPKAERLVAVRERFTRARRPVLLVGQGANRHGKLLTTLAGAMRIPVLSAPSARGVLPENHPSSFALDPFATSISALNEFLDACDLVLAVGIRLSHSDTCGFELKLPVDRLVHVDADPEVVGANYPASLEAVAGAGDFFEALLASLPASSTWTEAELEAWRARLQGRRGGLLEPRVGGTYGLDAKGFFDALRRALPYDAIVVLDSGLHQILARRYFRVDAPCGLLMPTDLQSMGFAIPTAIGARLAAPGRAVVALLGDGGFAMTGAELLTAAREGVSLIVIVLVDGAFGQIRMQQLGDYGVGHGVTLRNPDFALFAAAVGARHEVAGNDLEGVVRAATARNGVSVIEVAVGETLAIRRGAAVARIREGTRRVFGRRIVSALRRWLRSF